MNEKNQEPTHEEEFEGLLGVWKDKAIKAQSRLAHAEKASMAWTLDFSSLQRKLDFMTEERDALTDRLRTDFGVQQLFDIKRLEKLNAELTDENVLLRVTTASLRDSNGFLLDSIDKKDEAIQYLEEDKAELRASVLRWSRMAKEYKEMYDQIAPF